MTSNEVQVVRLALPIAWAAIVIVIALFLAYATRRLSHRETMRLYERNGEAGPILEARERWRNRWARLHGLKLIVVGAVLLLWEPSWTWAGELRALMPVIALMLIAIGLLTTVAYARWNREEEDRLHPLTAEQLAERARRRRRAGFWVGAVVVFIAFMMFVLAASYAILEGKASCADDLHRLVVNLSPLERAVYTLVASFLLFIGAVVMVICGWLGRAGRSGTTPSQGQQR